MADDPLRTMIIQIGQQAFLKRDGVLLSPPIWVNYR